MIIKSVLVVGPGWNEKAELRKVNEDGEGNLVVFVNYPANTTEWLERKAKLEQGKDVSAGHPNG